MLATHGPIVLKARPFAAFGSAENFRRSASHMSWRAFTFLGFAFTTWLNSSIAYP